VTRGGLHHLEIWVDDLESAAGSWGWLLTELGWSQDGSWPAGRSWRHGETYLVIEAGPDVSEGGHERTRPGLNHLAFHAGTRAQVDRLVADCGAFGWELMFPDRHPHAGGPQHYAAYLEDGFGFEVELVADAVAEVP
jgi:catechol 2,3-dioxygenase-like lactoylglutathione lyase family enzyme